MQCLLTMLTLQNMLNLHKSRDIQGTIGVNYVFPSLQDLRNHYEISLWFQSAVIRTCIDLLCISNISVVDTRNEQLISNGQ